MKANTTFYFKFALGLFLLAFCSFGINAKINPEKLPPLLPLVYFHAVFMYTWLGFLPFQLHNRWVKNAITFKLFQSISWVLVGGIVATIFLMAAFKYQRNNPQETLEATFNLHTILNFVLLTGMTMYHRKSIVKYQKLLLLSGLIVILPALKRLLRIFLFEENFAFLLLLLLFTVFALHDFKHQKKIHRFTLLAGYLTLQSVGLSVLLSRFDLWNNTVHKILVWIPIA